MTTPTEHEGIPSTRSQYEPPYGSAPAYSDRGYDAGYGGAPTYGPPIPQDSSAQQGSSAVAPAATKRRGTRGPALLLLACLLSGGVGGAVAHTLDEDPTGATTASAPGVITRESSAAPAAASGTAEAAAATISPSVVTIAVTGSSSATGAFGRTATQPVSDTGSGIVLRTDGYIVTNNHVVSAAVSGGSVSVTFSDGSTVPATIVGTDPSSDLAVIKVDKPGLTAAVFANSDEIAVGQPVLAVGAPLGLRNTVTQGIVSTLNRPVRTGEAGASEQSVIDAVQTDAAINPGNSGGALVDLAGRVIGVNSAIASTGDSSDGSQAGNIGVGFAIPSNDVTEISQQLITDGKATHSQIGISVGDASGTANGTPGGGATVRAVTPGGPAASAGLQEGDVITKVDDRAVTDADSLIVAIRSHEPGDTVTVTYTRGGSTQTAQATLAESSAS
ncbi:MAG TPA: trypsin-like peptidase domain-containing protein [Mycobacteriales bacterium]|jgi:putative serine protease PepD|nr:trypsin-like peptidase domain-containing protein [Mycobacteriales bacterium]